MATRLRALQGALVVLCAGLLASLPAWAQHAGAPSETVNTKTDRLARRPPHLVVAGYTTPGSTLDSKPAALQAPLGGTVYFAVFHNVARPGDAFGVRGGFDAGFTSAPNSSAFDANAQFLYLYQVVNDRAFHDPRLAPSASNGVVPAIGAETESTGATADIAGFTLALLCEPRQITSWGHFKASAFTIRPAEGAMECGDSSPLSDPSETSETSDRRSHPQESKSGDESPHSKVGRLALSAFPQIAQALPPKEYRPWPAKRLLDVTGLGFGVDDHRTGLDSVEAREGGIRLAAFAQSAKQGGVAPQTVQVAFESGALHGLPGLSGRRAVFRADWSVAALAPGRHSVVFGYTSNLPPVDTIGVISERAPDIVPAVSPSAAVFAGPCCAPPCCCAVTAVVQAVPVSRIVPASGIPTPGDRSGFASGNLGRASGFRGGSAGGTSLGLFSSFPGGFGGGPPGGGGGPGNPNSPPRDNPPGGNPPRDNPPEGDPPGGDPPGGDPPGGDPPGDDPPGPVTVPAPAGIVLALLGIPFAWYLSRRRKA
jgi:hypothetical protein